MLISIIIPCFNSGRYIEQTVESILGQELPAGWALELIVVDGGSSDNTMEVLAPWRKKIAHLISEPDEGPAHAINKGFALAGGELCAWLNADDTYNPDTLKRAIDAYRRKPERAVFFGRCRIVDEQNRAIRRPITIFKELFFPFSCQFAIQTINYISQPASFFRRSVLHAAGGLRQDMVAAFDYELILRLWRQGGAYRIKGAPLSNFRWHPGSISGQNFTTQFKEELEAAVADAGRWSPQAALHWVVRHAIVSIYNIMAWHRKRLEMARQ